MVKEGYWFGLPVLALAFLALFFQVWLLFGVLAPLSGFVFFFFRDPTRVIPSTPGAILSPADGKVIRAKQAPDGVDLSIFLSIFDVHVNRAPSDGRISRMDYRPGSFRLAYDDRASVENEQLRIGLDGPVQISLNLVAGLVARRIVPWIQEGDEVSKGDKIGLIRFGSRVDLHLPGDCRLIVEKGDRVLGGSSVIAFQGVSNGQAE